MVYKEKLERKEPKVFKGKSVLRVLQDSKV